MVITRARQIESTHRPSSQRSHQRPPNPHQIVASSTISPHVNHLINRGVSFHFLYLLSRQTKTGVLRTEGILLHPP